MIIDTTYSSLEARMAIARRFEEASCRKPWPSGWKLPREKGKARAAYRASAIREFLRNRGEIPPDDLRNAMVFWKNGEIQEILWVPGKEPLKEKDVEKTFESALKEFLDLITLPR